MLLWTLTVHTVMEINECAKRIFPDLEKNHDILQKIHWNCFEEATKLEELKKPLR